MRTSMIRIIPCVYYSNYESADVAVMHALHQIRHSFVEFPYTDFTGEGRIFYNTFETRLLEKVEDFLLGQGQVSEEVNVKVEKVKSYLKKLANKKAAGMKAWHAKCRTDIFTSDVKRTVQVCCF